MGKPLESVGDIWSEVDHLDVPGLKIYGPDLGIKLSMKARSVTTNPAEAAQAREAQEHLAQCLLRVVEPADDSDSVEVRYHPGVA